MSDVIGLNKREQKVHDARLLARAILNDLAREPLQDINALADRYHRSAQTVYNIINAQGTYKHLMSDPTRRKVAAQRSQIPVRMGKAGIKLGGQWGKTREKDEPQHVDGEFTPLTVEPGTSEWLPLFPEEATPTEELQVEDIPELSDQHPLEPSGWHWHREPEDDMVEGMVEGMGLVNKTEEPDGDLEPDPHTYRVAEQSAQIADHFGATPVAASKWHNLEPDPRLLQAAQSLVELVGAEALGLQPIWEMSTKSLVQSLSEQRLALQVTQGSIRHAIHRIDLLLGELGVVIEDEPATTEVATE